MISSFGTHAGFEDPAAPQRISASLRQAAEMRSLFPVQMARPSTPPTLWSDENQFVDHAQPREVGFDRFYHVISAATCSTGTFWPHFFP